MSKLIKFIPAIAAIVVGIAVIVGVAVGVQANLPDVPPSVNDGGEGGSYYDPAECVHVGGNATCTEKAVCSLCGEKYGEPRGHNVYVMKAVAPTCTEEGLSEGEKCLRCETVLKAQETVPATGHTLVNVEGSPATCTVDGYSAHKKCENCNFTEGKMTLSASHSYTSYAALEPTCTTDGYTAYSKCSKCGNTTGYEVLPAGHSFGDPDANETRTCSACGLVEVSTYDGLVAALETDNANIVMVNDIEGTATQSSGYGVAGVVLNAGDVLDGNGYKLTINGANKTWDCAVAMKGGEVRNLTISGAFRGVFMPGANGDVVIDKCVFADVTYTFNSDAGSKDYTVMVKNTTLNGWTSFSNVHKAVTFENCEFGEGRGYKFCRPYQATTFTNCAFAEGFEIDISQTAGLVFNECNLAGEALTVDTAEELFIDGGTVEIDGIETHFHNWETDETTGNKTCTACGTVEIESSAGLKDALANIQDGDTVILPTGTYELPASISGKNVVLEGAGEDTVFDFTKPYNVGDASITFRNLKIQSKNENVMNNLGIQHTTGDIVYENCTFDGAVVSEHRGTVTYIGCTFTGTGYITTYAVDAATFIDCTFDKADSRAVLVYSHGDTPCVVTLTDCEFYADAIGKTGAGDWTAAVEVDTTNISSPGTSVTVTNCTIDDMYSGIVRDKSSAGKANAVITVDGQVWAFQTTQLMNALEADNEIIDIVLLKDISVNISTGKQLGGANTQSITITGINDSIVCTLDNTYRSYFNLANPDGKLYLNDMTLVNTHTGTHFFDYTTHFNCDVVAENVNFAKAPLINSGVTAVFTDCDFNQNSTDGYGLWIMSGANVTVSGGVLNSERGFKIADENSAAAETILNVSGTKFNNIKKAAILVTTKHGATVTVNNLDISNCQADNTNPVWIDEDRVEYANTITVIGGSVINEP